jgi:hypothetical protein
MNTILPALQLLLNRAQNEQVEIPQELVEEFTSNCVTMLTKQFGEKKEEGYRHRLSAMGKPLCQLQMEKREAPREQSEPFFLMKMMFGDMAESLLVLLLKLAGVKVEATSLKVEWDGIPGELDIIIDGKVYDIKTASPYAFTNKFNSFESLQADDTFGYVPQLYGYAAAKGIPVGGWIVVNKATAEVIVLDAPRGGDAETLALHKIDKARKILDSDAEFKRCYKEEDELFYKKPTGNKVLGFVCGYCPYKNTCWDNISHEDSRVSKAKVKPKKWYVND